jgi:hypothetical protein
MTATPPARIDRFLIAALVDRLIHDSDTTFRAEDARALLDAIPRGPSPWFELGLRGKRSGGSARGVAAGHGDIRIDDKDRSFDYSTAAGHRIRAGQWKLLWIGRRGMQAIEIEQVMADVLDEGRGALIRYDRDGTPLVMEIRVNRSFRVFWSPVIVVFPGWRPWKTPV